MLLKYVIPFFFGLLHTQTVSKTTGLDWTTWELSQKSGYVNGFFSGLEGYEIILLNAEHEFKQRDQYWHSPLVIDIIILNMIDFLITKPLLCQLSYAGTCVPLDALYI